MISAKWFIGCAQGRTLSVILSTQLVCTEKLKTAIRNFTELFVRNDPLTSETMHPKKYGCIVSDSKFMIEEFIKGEFPDV
jgi:hypothetical protein